MHALLRHAVDLEAQWVSWLITGSAHVVRRCWFIFAVAAVATVAERVRED